MLSTKDEISGLPGYTVIFLSDDPMGFRLLGKKDQEIKCFIFEILVTHACPCLPPLDPGLKSMEDLLPFQCFFYSFFFLLVSFYLQSVKLSLKCFKSSSYTLTYLISKF